MLDFRNREFLFADGICRAQTHHSTKFCQNRSFRYGDIAIFRIFKMAAAAILDFWNRKIIFVIGVQSCETHQRAKFCQNRSIGCKDIKIFWFFKKSPPSCIFEIVKFYFLPVSGGPGASLYQISSKSVIPLQRYCDFLNFQDGRRAILDFWNREILWFLGSRGWRRISMLNFVKISQSVANILRFFDFLRWRPSAILDLFGVYMDHSQWVTGGLYHSTKFGYDRYSSFYNMNISIFGTFGWKMPIHTLKIGVFGQFDPLNGLQYEPKQKRHTFAWVRVIWAIKRENVVSGLTCRCVA